MNNYLIVLFFSLIGGVFSLIGGVLLISRKNIAQKVAVYATPFAAGALLAAVFLDLLLEGIEQAEPGTVLTAALVGMIIFFLAERFLRWFHHHHQHGTDPTASLVIVGDTIHNLLDGIAIAAAFLISIPTGIVTTIAVAAHEIPQEIGDFGLLLHKGLSRRKVIIVNVLSALATTAAALITYAIGTQENLPLGALIGLSAGFLLYIAASDIIPEIHERTPKQKLFGWQPLLLIVGAVVVAISIQVAHHFIEDRSPAHEHACVTYYDQTGTEQLFRDCPEEE